jgi:hypothetical protein
MATTWPVLVTFDQAQAHLAITVSVPMSDADLMLKMTQASAILCEYLAARADPTWTPETVPGPAQASVLLLLGYLCGNRGDSMTSEAEVWSAIERLCCQLRNPALA